MGFQQKEDRAAKANTHHLLKQPEPLANLHVSGFCNLDLALTIESYESLAHTPYVETRGREFL